MNKFYFKIGHLFLSLYNDKNTNIELKYHYLEKMQSLIIIMQTCLIDDDGPESFKKFLLDELYKDKDHGKVDG